MIPWNRCKMGITKGVRFNLSAIVKKGTMTHGVVWNDKHVMHANNSYALVGDERYDGLLELVYFIKHIIHARARIHKIQLW